MATYSATLTYTSTKEGYESGSQTFTSTDADNISAIKTFISSTIGSTNLLTAKLAGTSYGVPNYLFDGCSNMTSCDLSGFNIHSNNVSFMFRNCSKLTTLKLFTASSSIADISYMFSNCNALTSIDLSAYTFGGSSSVSGSYYYGFKGDSTFYNCTSLANLKLPTITLSCVSSYNYYVYYFGYMFSGCKALTSLTLNITSAMLSGKYSGFNAYRMFAECEKLSTLNFTLSSTTDRNVYLSTTDSMFYRCKALTNIDLSNVLLATGYFSTVSSSSLRWMFGECSNLQSITLPPSILSSKVTNINSMFYSCPKLTSLTSSGWEYLTNVTDIGWLFGGCSSLPQATIQNIISTIPTSTKITNIEGLFSQCSLLTSIDLSTLNTTNVTSMRSLFNECSNLTSITFGSNFDTAKVTNMSYMFYGCKKLTSLNISHFNTAKVTNMYNFFCNCKTLASLTIGSTFDTSIVTDMGGIFNGCNALDVTNIIKQLDYSSVTNFNYGLAHAQFSEIDYSALNNMNWTKISPTGSWMSYNDYTGDFTLKDTNNVTSNLGITSVNPSAWFLSGCSCRKITIKLNWPNCTSFYQLFFNCTKLKSFDLSQFSHGTITDIRRAFEFCNSLEEINLADLGIDLSRIASLYDTFDSCTSCETIDLDDLDLSALTDISYAFSGCINLKTIYAKNSVSDALSNLTGTFYNCTSLVGSNGTMFDNSKVDGTMAKLDTNDSVGYLSSKNKYTITYDAGEGSVSGGRTTYFSEDNNYTLPTPTPPTGYIFDGWKDSPSATTYVTVLPSGSSGNKSYTAYYTLVPIILNGTDQVTAIYLNGSLVTSLYLNGTQIF